MDNRFRTMLLVVLMSTTLGQQETPSTTVSSVTNGGTYTEVTDINTSTGAVVTKLTDQNLTTLSNTDFTSVTVPETFTTSDTSTATLTLATIPVITTSPSKDSDTSTTQMTSTASTEQTTSIQVASATSVANLATGTIVSPEPELGETSITSTTAADTTSAGNITTATTTIVAENDITTREETDATTTAASTESETVATSVASLATGTIASTETESDATSSTSLTAAVASSAATIIMTATTTTVAESDITTREETDATTTATSTESETVATSVASSATGTITSPEPELGETDISSITAVDTTAAGNITTATTTIVAENDITTREETDATTTAASTESETVATSLASLATGTIASTETESDATSSTSLTAAFASSAATIIITATTTTVAESAITTREETDATTAVTSTESETVATSVASSATVTITSAETGAGATNITISTTAVTTSAAIIVTATATTVAENETATNITEATATVTAPQESTTEPKTTSQAIEIASTTMFDPCLDRPCHYGTCIVDANSTDYNCVCNDGFVFVNKNSCEDYNECMNSSYYCGYLGTYQCTNLIGSYECACPIGYYLNNKTNTCRLSPHAITATISLTSLTFTDDLNDPTSATYHSLSMTIKTTVDSIYKNNFAYLGCTVTGFKKGSIRASTALSFLKETNTTDVQAQLEQLNNNNGTLLGPVVIQNVQQTSTCQLVCVGNTVCGNDTAGSNFHCTCATGYEIVETLHISDGSDFYQFDVCKEISNVCESQPCQNEGTCVQGQSQKYYCSCSWFYSGQNCEKAVPLGLFIALCVISAIMVICFAVCIWRCSHLRKKRISVGPSKPPRSMHYKNPIDGHGSLTACATILNDSEEETSFEYESANNGDAHHGYQPATWPIHMQSFGTHDVQSNVA